MVQILRNGSQIVALWGIPPFLTPSFDLPPNEQVTCMHFSNQFSLQPNAPPMPLLFVGTVITSTALDYDACSGRLLVLSLNFVVRDTPQPLDLAWTLSCDSVVMAMDSMVRESERFLVMAKSARLGVMTSGSQISMVDVANRQELSHQYPTRGYVTSLKVAKEFIIVGDLYNGLSFLRWVVRVRGVCESQGNDFRLFREDKEPSHVLHTGFMIAERQIALAKADEAGNFAVFLVGNHRADGGKR